MNKPEYEDEFQSAITGLVMRHIDRMNDVCDEDNATRIIDSFTKQFDPIFNVYLNKKFPGRQKMLDDVSKQKV